MISGKSQVNIILPCKMREKRQEGSLWNIFQNLDDSRVVPKIMKIIKI